MAKKNCWEVIKCGREPGGGKAEEQGVCSAALPDKYDGSNHGHHGGRVCWAIAGTFCKGKAEGTEVEKILDCINCNFFKQVNEEESNSFVLLPKGFDL